MVSDTGPKTSRRWRRLSVAAAVLAVFAVAVVGGCAPHVAYHVPNLVVPTSIDELRAASPDRLLEIQSHCFEQHDEFGLGFVEIDDQGDYWDPDQLDTLEEMIDEESKRPGRDGAVIVVFVHGWKHNATVCDENVACFREVLRSLDNLERLSAVRFNSTPRRIIGVYVGWRGLSAKGPLSKQLSFWSRKATAHRVGSGQLIELFSRLEATRDGLRRRGSSAKLVVVGHSFGGAVVYSATAGVLHERLARSSHPPVGAPTRVRGLGDLVVLVNPAFEAQLYNGIERISSSRTDYPPDQTPVLVTVSSETDTATGKAFPVGRFFSTLFARTSSPSQKDALTTTLGNYEPFGSHRLEKVADRGTPLLGDLRDVEGTARGKDDCRCRYIEADVLEEVDPFGDQAGVGLLDTPPAANEGVFGQTLLTRVRDDRHPLDPFLVVSTTDEVVSAHNGIYSTLFVDFLRGLLLEMETRERVAARDEVPE